MGYKLETTFKGKKVRSMKTFKTKAAAEKGLEKRIAFVSLAEARAVRSGKKKRLARIEKVEHAVMKAKIVKVA